PGGGAARRTAWRRWARRHGAHGGALLPLYGRSAGAVALGGRAGRGVVSVAGAARPRPRVGEPVFAGPVLPADARRLERDRGVAGRAGARAVARGGVAVAPRDPAALVDRVRGGTPRARRPVPGALLRSRHRAPRGWRERRLVDLVAAGGGGRRHGARVLGGGPGARHGGAAQRSVAAPGRVRVGGARGPRRPLAVAALWGLARVVHVRLAPGARGRGGAGAVSLGRMRHRHRRRHGRRARHLGRGGRGPPRSRRA